MYIRLIFLVRTVAPVVVESHSATAGPHVREPGRGWGPFVVPVERKEEPPPYGGGSSQVGLRGLRGLYAFEPGHDTRQQVTNLDLPGQQFGDV